MHQFTYMGTALKRTHDLYNKLYLIILNKLEQEVEYTIIDIYQVEGL